MDEKDPKTYELAVLVKTEDDTVKIASFLTEHKATLDGELKAKKIALAYPVKKATEGVFVSARFTALPENAKQLEKDLTLHADVLRSMILSIKSSKQQDRPTGDALVRPRTRTLRTPGSTATAPRQSSAGGSSLSNEALEKKIEEILK